MLAAHCVYPPTQVLITVETDATADRDVTVSVTVRPLGGTNATPALTFGRFLGATFPASFSVVPAPGQPRDGRVEVVFDVEIGGSGTSPAVRFRRVLRFSFVPRQPQELRVMLSRACARGALGCTSVSPDVCTVTVYCEERGGTCGDQGACVPYDVTPVPRDGGGVEIDAADATSASCVLPRMFCGPACVDPRISNAHCGRCGNVCSAPAVCANGACIVPVRDSAQACTSDQVCGQGGWCITAGLGYPGGFCIYSCSTDVDCPGVGACFSSSPEPFCMRRCSTSSDCRSGYRCRAIGGLSSMVCWPGCTQEPERACGPFRCNTATDLCNLSCANNADCSLGSTCDPTTRVCRCGVATACGAGRTCNTGSGFCGCAEDSVCVPGRHCDTVTGGCR